MLDYQPWNDSWRDQLVYIMIPYELDAPVEVPADFNYPIFLGAFEKRLAGDDFWKTIASAMVYVIGHQPNHAGTPAYVNWVNKYDSEIVKELIYDGIEQSSNGDLETAIWVFQASVLLDPQIADAHFNLGLSYYQLALSLLKAKRSEEGKNCLQKAAQFLENAVELDPKLRLAYYNLGFVYEHMGMQDESEKNLQKGIRAAERLVYRDDAGKNNTIRQKNTEM